MKKKTISKSTYKRQVRKYAKEYNHAFDKVEEFMDKYFKKNKKYAAISDELSKVIDTYIDLNSSSFRWCIKNGVNPDKIISDVLNAL